MKFYVLFLASILCVTEASFRSMDAHGASFDVASKHPAVGAALIVISEAAAGDFCVTNGVYIAPGKAVTHAHEARTGKTWVISPYAGGQDLVYILTLTGGYGNATISKFLLDMKKVLQLYPKACREVTIAYPRRELVDTALDLVNVDPDNIPFVKDPDAYAAMVAESPVKIEGSTQSIKGSDFCVLNFKPFDKRHPIAQLLDIPFEPDTVITVLGSSFYTHVCDGSDSVYRNTVGDFTAHLPKTGSKTISVEIRTPSRLTCFSQLAQEIGNRLMVRATYALAERELYGIPADELFEPQRTDPRTEAVVVMGLSGAGVYVGDKLVGLVSNSHHSLVSQGVENIYKKACEARGKITSLLPGFQEKYDAAIASLAAANAELEKLGDDEQALQREAQAEVVKKCEDSLKMSKMLLNQFQERAALHDATIAAYGACRTSVIEHPLFNVHQRITRTALAGLVDFK